MSKAYLPYEPDQQLLLPAALQEWLPDDHLAYFISDVVDQLDMSEITARYDRTAGGSCCCARHRWRAANQRRGGCSWSVEIGAEAAHICRARSTSPAGRGRSGPPA